MADVEKLAASSAADRPADPERSADTERPADPERPAGERCITELLSAFRAATMTADRVSVAAMIAALRDRAFGGLLVVFSLPNMLPLPVGLSILFDIPIMLVAAQMALGRRSVWLPRWLLRRTVRREAVGRAIDAVLPRLRRIERLLRPRLPVLTAPAGERIVGTVCFLLTIAVAIPLPIVSWLPAFALLLIAVGVMGRDGLVIAAGLIGGGVAIIAVAAAVAGFIHGGQMLLDPATRPL